MKPVITQEDKKLVGHLVKKKKQSGKHVHVYYNRKAANGKSKYLTGNFFSKKNNRHVKYRSSYELKFFQLLEEDTNVVSYEVEGIKIPYKDLDNSYKNYIPDVMVVYNTGEIHICEIKPNAMLDNIIVKRKAQACKTFLNKLFNNSNIEYKYRFVTETDLFKNATEYALFLKNNSN